MKPEEIKFWEDLSVAVEDVREMINTSSRPVTKLLNRLNKYNGWLEILNQYYGSSYDELKLLVRHLSNHKKAEFARLFCLVLFASHVDRTAIKNRLPEDIARKYESNLEDGTVSYESLLFTLLKTRSELLKGIFYDTIINRKPSRTFICKPEIDELAKLQNLSEEKVEKFFNKLREDRVIRREVKVWWFETNNSKTKLFVRLESQNRNPIPQVSKNLFLKTAGIKGMVLSENGNRLDVILSKDDKAVTTWMKSLIKDLTGKDVEYSRVVQEFEATEMSEFLQKLRKGEISGMKLLGVERRNAPLVNSPMIKLESSNMEPITDSLKELEDNHNLNLISEMKDIFGITVEVEGTTYRLSTPTNEDEKTIVSFENRNISEDKKDTAINALIKAIKK